MVVMKATRLKTYSEMSDYRLLKSLTPGSEEHKFMERFMRGNAYNVRQLHAR
jgi:hypothetical protein